MANFTTRVELYGSPTWDDYDRLHTAMAKEGFNRTIQWEGDNVVYQLPHAEYNRSCDSETDVILASAVKAASTVWKDFGVLVTKADDGRRAHNLKPA